MPVPEWWWGVVVWPLVGGLGALLGRTPAGILRWLRAVVLVEAGLIAALVVGVWRAPSGRLGGGWLFADALASYHLAVMALVFVGGTVYAGGYFRDEVRSGAFGPAAARRFAGLWCGALAAMALVLISNNLGLLWVGVEASTLMTAFLICVHVNAASLEAMWKYLLMCSVGVACAFLGTLLVAAAADGLGLPDADRLLWTRLLADADKLDVHLLKLGFIFLLVGYGTKAGLAPLHSWLPDAHSQAPAPVSAVFSGFLLNTALYAILRYTALLEAATDQAGWSLRLLLTFGVVSILVAAAFVLFQNDLKRLLAYSSIEHIGIMAVGVGLGGVGVFAALLHLLNHSLGKSLAFYAAGRLGQRYGTHHLSVLRDSLRRSPVWGVGLLGALLALVGMAPFGLFISKLWIARAAILTQAYGVLAAFLVGCALVFIGVLKQAIAMAWGAAAEGAPETPVEQAAWGDRALVGVALGSLLLLGLWPPPPLLAFLTRAAQVLGGQP